LKKERDAWKRIAKNKGEDPDVRAVARAKLRDVKAELKETGHEFSKIVKEGGAAPGQTGVVPMERQPPLETKERLHLHGEKIGVFPEGPQYTQDTEIFKAEVAREAKERVKRLKKYKIVEKGAKKKLAKGAYDEVEDFPRAKFTKLRTKEGRKKLLPYTGFQHGKTTKTLEKGTSDIAERLEAFGQGQTALKGALEKRVGKMERERKEAKFVKERVREIKAEGKKVDAREARMVKRVLARQKAAKAKARRAEAKKERDYDKEYREKLRKIDEYYDKELKRVEEMTL
jgi:hypothetical protein